MDWQRREKCMERNSHFRTAQTWQPEGKQRQGRPRTTWRRTVEHERRCGFCHGKYQETWQWIEMVGESLFWPHAPNCLWKMRQTDRQTDRVVLERYFYHITLYMYSNTLFWLVLVILNVVNDYVY